MDEALDTPTTDQRGISEAITTTPHQPSFLRVMLILAATVVVLVGMRLSAPILNPILFAGLFIILGVSIGRFSADIASYTGKLNGQLGDVEDMVKRLGLSNVDLRDVVKLSALTKALSSVLGGVANFLSNLFLIRIIVLFLLAEGPAMMNRLRASRGGDNPQVERLTVFGRNVVRQLGLRAIVNFATGAGVTALLLVLGVDFPLMWGILAFFLSFIPWIGLPLAVAPAVVLALAESGVTRALLVIIGVIVINVVAENLLSPMLMGRGLSISPTVLFLGFIFWAWLLGGPGAFLAARLTILVVLMFETFPETRWLASLMGVTTPDAGAPDERSSSVLDERHTQLQTQPLMRGNLPLSPLQGMACIV